MTFWGYYIPKEILLIFTIVYIFLILCSTSFYLLNKWKASKLLNELVIRTRSWWFIATGIAIVVMAPKIYGTILIAYVSFVALREMLSTGVFRESDRTALFAAYFAIPVQFYIAYTGNLYYFLMFIPVVMYMLLPFILVLRGQVHMIGRSMALIPTILLLTVFMLSHMVMYFSIDVGDSPAGPGGLIIYLFMLTAFNDVFQFTWGKLLGKRKIVPKISPNKTWAGFVGGVLSTSALACGLMFLTPLEWWQALLSGFIIGISGFMGDLLVSSIKRDLQVKDLDDLIPGHGGAMDRLDSIIVTGPLFFHLLNLFLL